MGEQAGVAVQEHDGLREFTCDLPVRPGLEPGSGEHPLALAAGQQAISSAIGTIAFAGQYATGQFAVQFNRSDGPGFSSAWPQWAYEIAKTALVSGKRVWVFSNGDPFGPNLTAVMIFGS